MSAVTESLGSRAATLDLHDSAIALCFVAATVAWTLLVGKEMNFDQLSYHFYLPYQLLDQRLGRDFMAANAQSYLNPLAYAPFFLMVTHGWHSLLITAVLASFHALNVVLAYFVGREVTAGRENSRALAALGASLAFVSPVFLVEAGTSFIDVSTAAPVMAAILLILRSANDATFLRRRIFLAGVLLGIASGLKLSNLVFGLPCALMLPLLHPSARQLLLTWLLLAAGALLGFVLAHGYWSWELWKEFGNPFVPFFNGFFQSADFPATGAGHERFIPNSLLEALLLPFRMLQLRSWIYIESVSPDIRFALFTIALSIAAVAIAIRRRSAGGLRLALQNKAVAILVFFVISFVCWIWTSGNGRYGLIVSLMCGPALVLTCMALVRNQKWLLGVLSIIVVAQALHLSNGDLRWNQQKAWTAQWFNTDVPERLAREPYLYVSVGGASNSYIIPFLAEGSAFTNPIGQTSVDLKGPGGSRLKSLLSRYSGRIRVMAMDQADGELEEPTANWLAGTDTLVARLGYAIDATDCDRISSDGRAFESGQDFDVSGPAQRWLRTCRLVPRPFVLEKERVRAAAVAARIVSWCPRLFKPAYTVMEKFPHGWFASYPATDMMLLIREDGVVLAAQTRTTADLYLGTIEDWDKDKERPDCSNLPTRPRDVLNFD